MPIDYSKCIELWREALKYPLGISVETTDRYYLSQNLYQARKVVGDQDLQYLGLVFPPQQNELWIVRKANAKDGGRAFDEGDVEPIHIGQEKSGIVLRPRVVRTSETDN